ncbi:SRPBCC family protein [Pseudomonas peli]|uniref:SRPBCC family protein n=1 Tax=Pseudomonas peli TaxID=592361 RepID=UPI0024AD2AB9|nr:SRPBCC family protein [Pseudomonas peli]
MSWRSCPASPPDTYDGNWKLQNENGLDGYHVSTVHYNYVGHGAASPAGQPRARGGSATLDYSKLGAGDARPTMAGSPSTTATACCSATCPTLAVRSGYARIMPRLVEEYGQDQAEWMMHRLRNLNIYPSLFFSRPDQLAAADHPPQAWNKT